MEERGQKGYTEGGKRETEKEQVLQIGKRDVRSRGVRETARKERGGNGWSGADQDEREREKQLENGDKERWRG